jgi:hypothetical protein
MLRIERTLTYGNTTQQITTIILNINSWLKEQTDEQQQAYTKLQELSNHVVLDNYTYTYIIRFKHCLTINDLNQGE